ncbi:MAG: hypothetical protein ACRDSE_15345, partial [Pseudonocardiaceae bacterium]
AGGVVQIHGEAERWPVDRLRAEVMAIGDRVADVLDDARRNRGLPLEVAEALAHRHLMQPAPA